MKRLILIAALLGGTAHAEFYSGNQLLNLMNGSNMEQMHALGYVVGIADVWTGVRVCAPSGSGGINAGQVNDVVKQYLTSNPHLRHQTADGLTLTALSNVWPCANRSNGGRQL